MKKVYIYDIHRIGALEVAIQKLQIDGIDVVSISSLCHIEDEAEVLIINPLSSVMTDHWEEIKQFISANKCLKIIMVTPDFSKRQLEGIIGKHDHVKIFAEDLDFGDLLDEIIL